jgi:hypothetical protein
VARKPQGIIFNLEYLRVPEEKSPIGRPKRRWEINITLDPTEIGCESVDRMPQAEECPTSTFCDDGKIPCDFINYLDHLAVITFGRRT